MNVQPQQESNAILTYGAQTQPATHFGAGRVSVFPLRSACYLVRGGLLVESLRREKAFRSFFEVPFAASAFLQAERMRATAWHNAIAAGSREPMQDCSDGR